jgi:hypothetical protein
MPIRCVIGSIVLCTLLSKATCLGADYYVDSLYGNDRNTGRAITAAWQTLAKVNSYAGFVPGDRILLRRGRLWREQLVVPCSGTAGKPLLVGAYGTGERPVLKGSVPVTGWAATGAPHRWRAQLAAAPNQVFFDGLRGARENSVAGVDQGREWHWSNGVLYVYARAHPDVAYAESGVEASVRPAARTFGLVDIKDREYVIVQDVEVTQSYGFGIYIKPWARHVTIRNCEVSHALDGGLVVTTSGAIGASRITVEDCVIHHNNGGFKEGVPGVATYHEGLTMENVDGFVIRGTQVYANYMEGVNFKRGARDGVIECCDLYANDLINLYIEGASNIQVRYNRIYDCTYNAGIEFGLETSAYHNDTVRIHHNLFWGNSGGVSFWAAGVTAQTRNIQIDNNTFYDNELAIRWKSGAAGNYSGTNEIRNNLFWPHRPGWSCIRDYTPGRQGIARTSIRHNAYQRGAATDTTGAQARLVTDPQLVSPSSLNFHLRHGSACIDVGMDVGLTADYDGNPIPQGLAPDIGAHEYVFDTTDAAGG